MQIDNKDTIGFQKLKGRTPWTDIADHPSDHIANRSRPDSDCNLEEPSHMKLDSINCWLQHWLKLQKKGRRPLVLKDPSSKSSQAGPTPRVISNQKDKQLQAPTTDIDNSEDSETVGIPEHGLLASETIPPTTASLPESEIHISKGKGKRAKVGKAVLDVSDGQNHMGMSDNARMNGDPRAAISNLTSHGAGSASDGLALPASPLSMSESHYTCRLFLESLSTDVNYRRMLCLLDAAPVSRQIMLPESADMYMPSMKTYLHNPPYHG